MILEGCHSRAKEVTVEERVCPDCGHIVEVFSTDTEVTCEKCGCTIYNEMLSCVEWCKHARECVGDAMYEHMMKKLAESSEGCDDDFYE